MALNDKSIYRRFSRFVAVLCVCSAALCVADASWGLSRADLYQATAPVTDRSEAAQAAAFQSAMKMVLVRVTGRRTADEDAVYAPLVNNARRYVQQYSATSDGQLRVSFDAGALERWLTQNGQPLWGRERPSTFVWLTLQGGPQGGSVATAEDTSDLKSAIDAVAIARGVPLQWPSAAQLQREHLDYASVSAAMPATLADAAHRAGSDGVLIGRANNGTAAASVRWTHLFQDRSSEFSGGTEGINRAADVYASLFAASGALAPVDIEVAGVADLHAYANVQTYLESLTSISHVSVQSFAGDTIRFRLTTRGGVEALQHTLALSGRLQPLPSGNDGIQRFQLHR